MIFLVHRLISIYKFIIKYRLKIKIYCRTYIMSNFVGSHFYIRLIKYDFHRFLNLCPYYYTGVTCLFPNRYIAKHNNLPHKY